MRVIITTLDPESWRPTTFQGRGGQGNPFAGIMGGGGSSNSGSSAGGAVAFFAESKCLIVRQTADMHGEIERLIEGLTTMTRKSTKAPAAPSSSRSGSPATPSSTSSNSDRGVTGVLASPKESPRVSNDTVLAIFGRLQKLSAAEREEELKKVSPERRRSLRKMLADTEKKN